VIWLPVNTASALGSQGDRQALAGNFVDADRSWSQANRLAPWDPIYPAVAGQKLLEISTLINQPEDSLKIENRAIEFYQKAVIAAPYDALFQHNLAVMLMPHHLQDALIPASRSVNLENRDLGYTYYILGLAYLNQGEIDKAVHCFVLQGMSTPKFLTVILGEEPNLKSFNREILERSLAALETLKKNLSPTDPGYAIVQQNLYFLRWWHRQLPSPLPPEVNTLPPFLQILLLADTQPDLAIDRLNQILAQSPTDAPSLFLRAWLKPDQYFDSIKTIIKTSNRLEYWKKSMSKYRDLRTWLATEKVAETSIERVALWLTYRNMSAMNASDIFIPPGLYVSGLARDFGLYPEWPRYFPALDYFIDQYRREKL
jgi:tetratricopeptide (TPR) repeat protein